MYLVRTMKTVAMFRKKVSKGSRFNQIYVPKNLDGIICIGDEVEVKLVKKKINLYYSKDLNKISEFKEKLITGMFLVLEEYKEIRICFVIGSFLTKMISYNDIDLVIIIDDKFKDYKLLKEKIYNKLINKFNQNFHILLIQESKFNNLLMKCPLTISMFDKYISSERIDLRFKRELDKRHIEFLLMMPEDLLEINVQSKIFLDNIRRLVTIERFLDKKLLNLYDINKDIWGLVNRNLYNRMDSNDLLLKHEIKFIRNIIKLKIKKIKETLKRFKDGEEI